MKEGTTKSVEVDGGGGVTTELLDATKEFLLMLFKFGSQVPPRFFILYLWALAFWGHILRADCESGIYFHALSSVYQIK